MSSGDVVATSVTEAGEQDGGETPVPEPGDTRWAFEAAGIGVAETTASGEILSCSGAAARLCGYPDASALGAGCRLPDALLAFGGLAVASSGARRFEVCFQTPDGLLRWVLGSARWHQVAPSAPPVLQWLLVDRSEYHRSVLRARFVRHMETVTRLLPSAAADCTALVGELAATVEDPSLDRPASTRAGNAPSAHAALQRVQAVLEQLARFAQTRARRPIVLPVNAALVSLAPMLSWLAGEDSRCDISRSTDELRINADPADLEDLLARMVMAGRDCLPAGGTLTLRAGTTRADASEGGVPVHRAEAAVTLTAQGYGCEPVAVPAALTETVARLGGRAVATHDPGHAARLSVLLVPVLGAVESGVRS